jgi:hypothetical protein
MPSPLPGRILVSRNCDRPQAQLYGFNLGQEIPAFGIPLHEGESEPLLKLQPLVHKVYDRARFELAIDYSKAIAPQLNDSEQKWVLEFVES